MVVPEINKTTGCSVTVTRTVRVGEIPGSNPGSLTSKAQAGCAVEKRRLRNARASRRDA